MEQLTIIRDQVWGEGGEVSFKGLGFLTLIIQETSLELIWKCVTYYTYIQTKYFIICFLFIFIKKREKRTE
jgi:hypothetical protein